MIDLHQLPAWPQSQDSLAIQMANQALHIAWQRHGPDSWCSIADDVIAAMAAANKKPQETTMSEPKKLLMPPDDLIQVWETEWEHAYQPGALACDIYRFLCFKATQWGANQQLEACCDWLEILGLAQGQERLAKIMKIMGEEQCWQRLAKELREAFSPKPVSALELFNGLMSELDAAGEYSNYANRIRRALEALPNE